jgi:hypothetical protein
VQQRDRIADIRLDQHIRSERECDRCCSLLGQHGDDVEIVRIDCPQCGQSGCTACVDYSETGTCCLVPQ